MSPRDYYGWYCALRSVTEILGHAAKIHAKQTSCAWSQTATSSKRSSLGDGTSQSQDRSFDKRVSMKKLTDDSPEISFRTARSANSTIRGEAERGKQAIPIEYSPMQPRSKDSKDSQNKDHLVPGGSRMHDDGSVVSHRKMEDTALSDEMSVALPQADYTLPLERIPQESQEQIAHNGPPQSFTLLELEKPSSIGNEAAAPPIADATRSALRHSKLPSSRIGRMFHYGGLIASLGLGAASEILRRSSSRHDPDTPKSNSLLMTEGNINRLVSKLSQMRGAALKLGQFMSIQDSHVLPEELERVFRRVQDSAHYMPNSQMEKVMSSSLGPSWRSHFSSFDPIPSHSASIGQVHTGVLAPSSSPNGKEVQVAIKIQFPRIAESISSDLSYVKMLLGASALLPKGLFLDSTINAFRAELADECDYRREASFIRKFREMDAIRLDSRYKVPWVWDGSTEHVLVMERMEGISVGGDVVKVLTQEDKNEIASRIIELCLRELFQFRMMQTDPNWTNFLWNSQARQIELIDFGATREYSKEFIDGWLQLLTAAIRNDRDACIKWSRKVGYFIGGENEEMVNAHLTSMQLLGTPFRDSTPQPFSFSPGSAWSEITQEIRAQIPIMLKNRLTPPPRETYSLNRKLSGAFLLAGRLEASVDCKSLWHKVVDRIIVST